MFRRKNVFVASVSLFLIAALMFSAMTASAQYTIGVKAGDWIGFGDFSFEFASNMPGYEESPPGMNMSWNDMEVLSVSDSNITCRSTTIYANGTESTDVLWGDIATGEGNFSVGIIPSNLGVGDEIPANLTWYTEEPLKLTINGTVTRRYAGANREVVYANLTYPIIYGNVTYGAWNMSFYWDKKTGVMCEDMVSYAMSYTANMTQYYMNMSMFSRMTATNMWPTVFPVDWNGYTFNVTMLGNSTISDFDFSQPDKVISFNVTGPTDKGGYCNVSIPKALLWCDDPSDWIVSVNSQLVVPTNVMVTNDCTYLYLTYSHSTKTVEIVGTVVIPEFPTWTSILLILFVLTVAILIWKKTDQNTKSLNSHLPFFFLSSLNN